MFWIGLVAGILWLVAITKLLGDFLVKRFRIQYVDPYLLAFVAVNILFGLLVFFTSNANAPKLFFLVLSIFALSTERNILGQVNSKFLRRNNIWISCLFLFFQFIAPYQTFDEAIKTSFTHWGSANNDVFDGLCGAHSMFTVDQNVVSSRTEISDNEIKACKAKKNEYLDNTVLQYSGLELFAQSSKSLPSYATFYTFTLFWTVLFFRALLNFFQRVLNFTKRTSYVLAFISIFSHIYFVTILNGHIGTIMMASVVANLLTLISSKDLGTPTSLSIITLLIFSAFCYPYMIAFIFIYFIIALNLNESFKAFSTKLKTLILASIFIIAWFALEEKRLSALVSFRSWHSFATPLGPLQYIGLVPGNILGSSLLGISQELQFKYNISDIQLSVISILISIMFLKLLLSRTNLKSKNYVNLLFFLSYSIMLTFFVTRDSYFIYKISYILQFIFIGLIYKSVENLDNSKFRTVALKRLSMTILIAIFVVNLFFNFLAFKQIQDENSIFSKYGEKLKEMKTLDLNRLFLLEPLESQSAAILNYLTSFKKSHDLTDYRLGLKIQDGDPTLVRSLPDNLLLLTKTNVSSFEGKGPLQFRWIYTQGSLKFAKANQLDYKVNIDGVPFQKVMNLVKVNSNSKSESYQICMSLPDWSKYQAVSFYAVNDSKQTIVSGKITKSISCNRFVLPGEVSRFSIYIDKDGYSPSMYDGRHLIFQLWNGGGEKYSSIYYGD